MGAGADVEELLLESEEEEGEAGADADALLPDAGAAEEEAEAARDARSAAFSRASSSSHRPTRWYAGLFGAMANGPVSLLQ